jgi:hypothetical protein
MRLRGRLEKIIARLRRETPFTPRLEATEAFTNKLYKSDEEFRRAYDKAVRFVHEWLAQLPDQPPPAFFPRQDLRVRRKLWWQRKHKESPASDDPAVKEAWEAVLQLARAYLEANPAEWDAYRSIANETTSKHRR